jgi:hypothetical protein
MVANCGFGWIGPRRFPRCPDPDEDIHCSYCCPERYVIYVKAAVWGGGRWCTDGQDGGRMEADNDDEVAIDDQYQRRPCYN